MDEYDMMEEALMEGAITVTCPECKGKLRCEPDADKTWCEICNKLVKPKDSLRAKGLI